MRLSNIGRRAALTVVAGMLTITAAACAGQESTNGGNDTGSTGKAALPAQFPELKGPKGAKEFVQAIVGLSAAHAKSIPDEWRNPTIIDASEGDCEGFISSATPVWACKQGDEYVIVYNPEVLWQSWQGGEGGGAAMTQDYAMSAYSAYLTYREAEHRGINLYATDKDTMNPITWCMQGRVLGGLMDNDVLGPESTIADYYIGGTDAQRIEFIQKGMAGEC